MRTRIHCLTHNHLFSLLLNCSVSPSLQFLPLSFFFLLFDLLFFLLFKCSLTVIFLNSNFCFCFLRLLTISLVLYFLSLMIEASFFFLSHLASFYRFRFFEFFLSITFLFPPFSVFFFSGLFANFFFYLSGFDSGFYVLLFFWGGFLMLLWFLLHCILSVLSSFSNFDFSFFLVNSHLAPVCFLPDSCFFSEFLHCFQPSFVLSF